MTTSTKTAMLALLAASIAGGVCWQLASTRANAASKSSRPTSTEQELATLKAQVSALQADRGRTVVVVQPPAA